MKRLSKEDGTHSVTFSPDAHWYIDRYSNASTMPSLKLYDRSGEERAVLAAPHPESVARFDLQYPSFFQHCRPGWVRDACPDSEARSTGTRKKVSGHLLRLQRSVRPGGLQIPGSGRSSGRTSCFRTATWWPVATTGARRESARDLRPPYCAALKGKENCMTWLMRSVG